MILRGRMSEKRKLTESGACVTSTTDVQLFEWHILKGKKIGPLHGGELVLFYLVLFRGENVGMKGIYPCPQTSRTDLARSLWSGLRHPCHPSEQENESGRVSGCVQRDYDDGISC